VRAGRHIGSPTGPTCLLQPTRQRSCAHFCLQWRNQPHAIICYSRRDFNRDLSRLATFWSYWYRKPAPLEAPLGTLGLGIPVVGRLLIECEFHRKVPDGMLHEAIQAGHPTMP